MLRAAEITWKTDTGRQRRDNEDSAFARAPVFVVADGMGGAQAGEVASRIAVDTFEKDLPDSGTPEERLADCVRAANRRIYDLSREEHERAGMGTTLTAAYLDDSDLAIAHVGDSRAYMFRDGALTRLTQDHSLVEELVRRGKLTEEQAAEHPQRSIITRALGPEPHVEVDTRTCPVRDGDILLLCSDGLTSMINEETISEILGSASTLQKAAQALIGAANDAGGRDNITVVLFRLEEVGANALVEEPTVVSLAASGSEDTDSAAAPAQAPAAAPAQAPTALRAPAKAPRRSAVQVPPRARRAPGVSRPRKVPGRPAVDSEQRPRRRFVRPLAALIAVVSVLFLVGGGGYLATRQLFFVGTNPQGIITIYRGLPYELPAGIHLYETFYVSGVPASVVPADRRKQLLNHQLRSQSDASALVRDLELGKVSR